VIFAAAFLAAVCLPGPVLAASTYYVATTGNDSTGTGSIGAPYLTITKALTVVANGDTIIVEDGSYAPTTVWSITKSITIQAQNTGGATLNAVAGQASIINIAFTAGGTFSLSGFALDGTNSTTEIVRMVNETTTYTFNSNNNVYQNIPLYAILGSSSADKAILSSTGDTFTGTSVTTAIYRPTVSAGSTSITNGTFNLASSVATNGLAWSIKANAAGTTFSSRGNTVNATTTYTAGEVYGVSVYNTVGTLANDTITITSNSAASCTPILISQVAGAPLLAENGTLTNETTTNNCAGGGHGITIGSDGDPGSSNRNYVNGWTISGSHMYASTTAQALGVHGILFGWESGGTAYGNYANGLGYTWLSKGMGGTMLYYGNIGVNTQFASQDVKGSQPSGCTSYINNTSYLSSGTAVGNRLEVETATGLLPVLCAFENNIYYGNIGQFVQWAQGSTLPTTIATNDYYATTTIATNAWNYFVGSTQTNLGTLAGWQSAEEPTSLSADPLFVSAPGNLNLSSGSALNVAGTHDASAPNDYTGSPFASVRSVGAYQYVDTAAPSVSLTSPASDSTVSGTAVSLSATASDDAGVAGVQFKLDTNTNIGSEDTSSPYATTWDSTNVADGTHTLVAVARDGAGNFATSSTITITVANAAPSSGSSGVVIAPQATTTPATATSTPPANTPSLTSAQISAILSLLASFNADQSVIDKVSASLRGTAPMSTAASSSARAFTRNLQLHDSGADVHALQEYLNGAAFTLAASGPGSPGNESDYFGLATYQALVLFQAARGISPASGYFGPLTRAYVVAHP
jgi:hypothetical protein